MNIGLSPRGWETEEKGRPVLARGGEVGYGAELASQAILLDNIISKYAMKWKY